jgi:malonyl-CoA/methylmalonyl-CoA synthetase
VISKGPGLGPYSRTHPLDKTPGVAPGSRPRSGLPRHSPRRLLSAHTGPTPTPHDPVSLALFARVDRHRDRPALLAPEGVFSYGDLLAASEIVATRLLAGRDDLEGERICFLVPPGWEYVAVQWGIWRAGGLAVPLATSHPPAELAHVLDDAKPEVVVAHPSLADRVEGCARERRLSMLQSPALLRGGPTADLPTLGGDGAALLLYTSGTTGHPKGVVLTHATIQAQVESLTEAWGWSARDHILLHLPLHHVHGVINVLTSALWNGATCEILPRFRPVDVWERLARGDSTLYMSVPTVYRRLIEAWEAADPDSRNAWTGGARACRLMVSGSAALPPPTLERWEQITGQRLLERYGMTEIGMALSNPLDGERRPGHVGAPLPGVAVRLVDEEGNEVPAGSPGEIEVRGATVFEEYWRRPDETAASFTGDGWFRTGDQAVVEGGSYRILGRSSIDILKTGGEKISALEIEDVLRSHEGVADCAVVGVADVDWGDRVCAAVVPRPSSRVTVEELRAFAKARLAPYKVPKDLLLVDDLPRNAMGKVTKPAVRELFTSEEDE